MSPCVLASESLKQIFVFLSTSVYVSTSVSLSFCLSLYLYFTHAHIHVHNLKKKIKDLSEECGYLELLAYSPIKKRLRKKGVSQGQ